MDKQTLIHLFYHDGKYSARKWRNVAKVPEVQNLPGGSLAEKVWNVLHRRPSCLCGKLTGWLNATAGYRVYCSTACVQKSPLLEFEKRHRQDKLWTNAAWKEETSARMRAAHFKKRGPARLAKIAEKNIVPLDEVTADRKKLVRWQHVCGEIFLKTFERPAAVYCPVCHVSSGQGELYEHIRKQYHGEIIVNDRQAIAPKEIGIYLPELKLGFEFNGKYWHPGDGRREASKSAECAEAGIQLVHVWETEWKTDRLKIMRKISKLLKAEKEP